MFSVENFQIEQMKRNDIYKSVLNEIIECSHKNSFPTNRAIYISPYALC